MVANKINKKLFKNYATKLIDELHLLLDFKLPTVKTWKIDWSRCQMITKVSDSKKPWTSIPFFEKLYNLKGQPAVYYFTVEQKHSKALFDAFVLSKKTSSQIRREKGLADENFFSISHVPKLFKEGDCIYVGSTKDDIYGRLIQHLGFTSGRTGALYLNQVLTSFKDRPEITFHYHLLEKKYINVTEHIESALQDSLTPFVGKRALKNLINRKSDDVPWTG